MHDLEIKTTNGLYLLSSPYFFKGDNFINIKTSLDKSHFMRFEKRADGHFYESNRFSLSESRLIYIKNSREHFLYERPFTKTNQETE